MLLVLSSEQSFSRKALKVSCSDSRDPQKNESAVSIVGLFCPVKPTQRSMQSQTEIGMLLIAFLAVAFLQGLVVHVIAPCDDGHTISRLLPARSRAFRPLKLRLQLRLME